MSTTTTIEVLQDYIADKEKQIEKLEDQYGQGVRPAWVGEEIAILLHYIRDAQAAIEDIKTTQAKRQSQ